MAGSILVVGLAARGPATDWASLFDDRTIVARTRSHVERIVPSGWDVTHAFDDLFDGQLAGIEAKIADAILCRAGDGDLAYVVPGPGWIGDATVSALAEMAAVEIAPATLSAPVPARAQVVDALLLAQAQERAPFDSGLMPLDATLPTVSFNWHGDRVIDLAARRLRTVYGIGQLTDADPHGSLVVQARDPLDGPPAFSALEYITARLRRPDGCPWDREQTHESMLDDFASEVDEFAEAVRAGDWRHAAEELGDVLLNVLMQARIGTEMGHFTIEETLAGINAKLVRRHPHVFADVQASTPDDVLVVWNRVKQSERMSASNPEHRRT